MAQTTTARHLPMQHERNYLSDGDNARLEAPRYHADLMEALIAYDVAVTALQDAQAWLDEARDTYHVLVEQRQYDALATQDVYIELQRLAVNRARRLCDARLAVVERAREA